MCRPDCRQWAHVSPPGQPAAPYSLQANGRIGAACLRASCVARLLPPLGYDPSVIPAPRRARPLPELEGEPLLRLLLAEIEEEERLGAALGVDLTPPAPSRAHAP